MHKKSMVKLDIFSEMC